MKLQNIKISHKKYILGCIILFIIGIIAIVICFSKFIDFMFDDKSTLIAKADERTYTSYDYVDVVVNYGDTVWEIVGETLNTEDYAIIQETIDMMYVPEPHLLQVGDTVKVPIPTVRVCESRE